MNVLYSLSYGLQKRLREASENIVNDPSLASSTIESHLARACGCSDEEREELLKSNFPRQIPVVSRYMLQKENGFRVSTVGHVTVIIPGLVFFDANPRVVCIEHSCVFVPNSFGGGRSIGFTLKEEPLLQVSTTFENINSEEDGLCLVLRFGNKPMVRFTFNSLQAKAIDDFFRMWIIDPATRQ